MLTTQHRDKPRRKEHQGADQSQRKAIPYPLHDETAPWCNNMQIGSSQESEKSKANQAAVGALPGERTKSLVSARKKERKEGNRAIDKEIREEGAATQHHPEEFRGV